MDSQITVSEELLDFISTNSDSNPPDIFIRYGKKKLPFDLAFAATQISCRNKTRNKIPGFISSKSFIFPDAISSEQASDERVARYHASLIGKDKKVVDLTAGLGIDAMTIANQGNILTAIEMNPLKASALSYNSKKMNIPNFTVVCADCIEYIDSLNEFPDLFFIDPSRRDAQSKRTYALSECLPNIVEFYQKLIEKGSELYIKASPLLDLTALRQEFTHIDSIHVISVRNECKEVLLHLKPSFKKTPVLHAIDLDDKGINTSFSIANSTESEFSIPIVSIEEIRPDSFLYEPNASMMKLNASKELCLQYPGLKKISPNTQLFLSSHLFPDFPGRIIKIKDLHSSKSLKTVKEKGYSIVARNYPTSAQELRKKLKVNEHPDHFLYAFRGGKIERPIIIEGERLSRH